MVSGEVSVGHRASEKKHNPAGEAFFFLLCAVNVKHVDTRRDEALKLTSPNFTFLSNCQ